jgi:replicative DNA helicase
MSVNQPPPNDIDTEKALICAMIIDSSVVLEAFDIVTEEDFYDTRHKAIAGAIKKMGMNGDGVDLFTLSSRLKVSMPNVQWNSYIAEIIDTVPAAHNIKQYAKIIKEKATLRQIIKVSHGLIQHCSNGATSKTAIELFESSLFSISSETKKSALKDIQPQIEENIENYENGLVPGLHTGFKGLDKLTGGFQKSDLIILAARPAMGKTAFALNIARNSAVESGAKVAVFSLEMSMQQLVNRLLCSEARIDFSRTRSGLLTTYDFEKITDAASRLDSAKISIDDTPGITVNEIRSICRKKQMAEGLDLVIIDYLQLIKPAEKTERRDLDIGEISRGFKILAKELDIPVIALSQLNRKLEDRANKRPQLADLRESGSLEQDSDVVMFIYRDEVYHDEDDNPNKGTAEIIVAKQRNGPIGTAYTAFLTSYSKFENLVY